MNRLIVLAVGICLIVGCSGTDGRTVDHKAESENVSYTVYKDGSVSCGSNANSNDEFGYTRCEWECLRAKYIPRDPQIFTTWRHPHKDRTVKGLDDDQWVTMYIGPVPDDSEEFEDVEPEPKTERWIGVRDEDYCPRE